MLFLRSCSFDFFTPKTFLPEPQATGYSNFQTPFVASNPRPTRDSSSNLYDYQEPAHQSYIPVSQPDRSQIESGYETPNAGYNAPSSSYYAPGIIAIESIHNISEWHWSAFHVIVPL